MIDTISTTCKDLAAEASRLAALLDGIDGVPAPLHVSAPTCLVRLTKVRSALDKAGVEQLAQAMSAPLFDTNGTTGEKPRGKPGGRK